MNIAIIILILIIINVININNFNKNLIYLGLTFYFILSYKIDTFVNSTQLLIDNKYPIQSYENVENLTFDFYKNSMNTILENDKSEIDLVKYGWPSNFNPQSTEFLDKIRFVETDKPIPTNADFF